MPTETSTKILVPVYWCSRTQDSYAADSAHITNERVCSGSVHHQLSFDAEVMQLPRPIPRVQGELRIVSVVVDDDETCRACEGHAFPGYHTCDRDS